MNVLLIQENRFIYDNTVYELDDMFCNQLFEECNEIAGQYDSDIWVVNEVFLNRLQPYKAIELFLANCDIDIIKLDKPDDSIIPLILDYAENNGIKVKGSQYFQRTRNLIYSQVILIITSVFLLYKMIILPHTSKVSSDKDKISLIRTPASKKKLTFLKEVDFRYEDFNDKNSIYSSFSRSKRIYWVIKSWIISYKEMNKISVYLRKIIGSHCTSDAYKYYSKRIVHTVLYSIIIDAFFAENVGKKFYTGNNLDRFALIEESKAKKYKIDIVCIPHGLEYGFKFPHCFIGNEFYTTSQNAAIHLNKLYNTAKFIFNQSVATNMFSINCNYEEKKRYIVFFTEPREVAVNLEIIEGLMPLLNARNLQLYLKLHPKDTKSNYEKYISNIKFIEDYNISLVGNICISRKSTTLLEAVYNRSKVAAILINTKDKVIYNTFPSLNDDNINIFYTINDLYEWILTLIDDK